MGFNFKKDLLSLIAAAISGDGVKLALAVVGMALACVALSLYVVLTALK